jgi:hypothetical protein
MECEYLHYHAKLMFFATIQDIVSFGVRSFSPLFPGFHRILMCCGIQGGRLLQCFDVVLETLTLLVNPCFSHGKSHQKQYITFRKPCLTYSILSEKYNTKSLILSKHTYFYDT